MARSTYQEDDRDVEKERAQSVQEEGEQANIVHVVHGATRDFPGDSHDEVHDGADGREVVKRDQRVHLVVGRAEKTLDHGQTQSLENDAADLVDDTDPDELDLADRSNDHTNDNDRYVQEDLEAGSRDAKGPSSEKNSDRGGGLQSSTVSLFALGKWKR